MKRVFTDSRFPGFEVHNEGDDVFRVYDRSGGAMDEIDSFRTYRGQPVTHELASRRAKDYFDRMAKGQMSQELADRPEHSVHVPTDNGQPESPDSGFGLSNSKSLDSLMGDNVMTADDVIDAYERAKALPNGPEKERAMAQVSSMSQQMESSAQELVRRLID